GVEVFVERIDLLAVIKVRAAAADIQARMVLKKLLMLLGAVLGRRIACLTSQVLLLLRQLGDFRVKNRRDDLVHLRLPFVGQLFQLGVDGGGLLADFIAPERDESLAGLFPVLYVVSRLEDGAEAVVVGLRDRGVTVVGALG